MNNIKLARIMWEAYSEQADYKTFNGKPLPIWEDLGAQRQDCWAAAAQAAINALGKNK